MSIASSAVDDLVVPLLGIAVLVVVILVVEPKKWIKQRYKMSIHIISTSLLDNFSVKISIGLRKMKEYGNYSNI
jgi:hypothetical protein